ncbi:MAG: SMR family transporter [Leucobacter sp.]
MLLAGAGLEAVWAIALDESRGFTVLLPAIVFCIADPLGMADLGCAMKGIPVCIAYAIWTGIGAALAVGTSMPIGGAVPSPPQLLFLAGIVGCVIGLRCARDPGPTPPTPTSTPQPPARG